MTTFLLQATSESGKRQRLHIINRVLEPLAPMNQDSSSAYVDLTAGKLLRDSSVYNIGENSIKYDLALTITQLMKLVLEVIKGFRICLP